MLNFYSPESDNLDLCNFLFIFIYHIQRQTTAMTLRCDTVTDYHITMFSFVHCATKHTHRPRHMAC